MSRIAAPLFALVAVLLAGPAPRAASDDGQRLLTIDHYVRVTSKVPSLAGQLAQIYVRERVSAGVALRVNLLGFAIAEVDYVRPLDRSRKGWLWQFGLTPGF